MSSRATTPVLIWRVRLLAVCLGLAAIAFRQSSGLIVPDSKLDLTAGPSGFMMRALHLWDPQGALGQLQNQAYGYLFPVGPFHLLLNAVGLPAWVIQRLWWTTILCVAFLGMWHLSRALGVAKPWIRLAISVAFALSPRMLSEVAVTSVEVWPMAMAPWVLLPLVVPRRSIRWRACWSGVAIALVGGVNAVATGAVLVLPALWLLSRRWDRGLARLGAAWVVAVLAACAWWMTPLLVLGRYSPPFLSWIESASVTTSTASVFQAFRGTSAWLGFLAGPAGAAWPAGWLFVVAAVLVVCTTIVAGAGLVGLALSDSRHVGFLAIGVVAGLALLTLGHVGPGSSFLAATMNSLLDGPLAPFRNTHKFELVARVPLTIAIGLLLDRVAEYLATRPALRRSHGVMPLVVTSLLVAVAAPGIGASMARAEGYSAIPSYWREAASWLDAQPAPGAVLVTPSANFSDLTWGSTKDEPLQALSHRPFVVRDGVPLGSAGATRLLDSLENRLGEGQRVAGLPDVLARAGIAYVLVRNDIRLDVQGNPPLAVHRALQASGLANVASFGPPSGAVGESATITIDYRTLVQRDSIEIYAVPGTTVARVVPAESIMAASAGPENLIQLSAEFGSSDFLLGSDASSRAVTGRGIHVLTDGQRRREVNFGSAAHNGSGLLAADDLGRSGRAVIDYDSDATGSQSHLTWMGVRSVTASSSASDAYASLRTGPANGPQSAMDGDLSTRWVSGTLGKATGEWLRVDFDHPVPVSGTTVVFSDSSPIAAGPSVVKVETEGGSATTEVFVGPGQRLVTPPGETRWMRILLAETATGTANGFSIAELRVPGIDAVPVMMLPTPRAAPDLVLLEEGARGRSECLEVDGVVRCSPTLGLDAEESGIRRAWESPQAKQYELRGQVRPRDGAAVEQLLALPSGWSATASSRLTKAPSGRPDAGIDADPASGWVASPDDPAPWFAVSFPTARRVTGLRLLKSYELPASTPIVLNVGFDDGRTVTTSLNESGIAPLPPTMSKSLHITFGDVRLMENIDSRTGVHSFAPIGFSDLVVRGAEDLVAPLDPTASTGVPCGFGPEVVTNGTRHLTSVSGTIGDLVEGRTLVWRTCESTPSLRLSAGINRVLATPSAQFVPSSLVLVAPGTVVPTDESHATALVRPSPAELRVAVPAREQRSIVVVAQNFNKGWSATDGGGETLEPIRVNGWEQGWVLPAGAATTLTAHFGPDTTYRWGLIGGALILIGLFFAAARTGTGRRDAVDLAPLPTRRPVGLALGLVALSGGLMGTAAVGLSLGLRWWLRRRSPLVGRLMVVVPLVLVAGASVWVAKSPWPGSDAGVSSALAQGLVWLAVAGALSFAGVSTWRPRLPDPGVRREPRTLRMIGRSMP